MIQKFVIKFDYGLELWTNDLSKEIKLSLVYFVNETNISSNHAISLIFLVWWGCLLLRLIFLLSFTFVENIARFQEIFLSRRRSLCCRPGPVWHNHTLRTVGSAHATSISNEKLITWIKPSSIRIITVVAWLSIAMTNMIAVWHNARFLSIFFLNVLKQVWASSVDISLF